MLDGDAAGRHGVEVIAGRLAGRCAVRVLTLPASNQPDQLNPEEIRSAARQGSQTGNEVIWVAEFSTGIMAEFSTGIDRSVSRRDINFGPTGRFSALAPTRWLLCPGIKPPP